MRQLDEEMLRLRSSSSTDPDEPDVTTWVTLLKHQIHEHVEDVYMMCVHTCVSLQVPHPEDVLTAEELEELHEMERQASDGHGLDARRTAVLEKASGAEDMVA